MNFRNLTVAMGVLALSACASPPPAAPQTKCVMQPTEQPASQVGRYQLSTTGNGIYLITDTATGKLWYYNIAPGRQEWIDISPPFTHAAPTTQTSSTNQTPVETETPVSAQAIESGQLKLTDLSAVSLETLLQDLNRRKDRDYQANDGQPGPDSAYLWAWVQSVTGELESRGYYFDDAGNLHGRGTIIALR